VQSTWTEILAIACATSGVRSDPFRSCIPISVNVMSCAPIASVDNGNGLRAVLGVVGLATISTVTLATFSGSPPALGALRRHSRVEGEPDEHHDEEHRYPLFSDHRRTQSVQIC
jgi:hypothetical protein